LGHKLMQDYLPKIQTLLSDWYLLTLSHPLYAGALALAVWLCLVIFYNLKMLPLKKKQKLIRKQNAALQEQVTKIEQALEKSDTNLAEVTQKEQNSQEAVSKQEEQVNERNLALVTSIRALANQFDLSEQLVGSASEMKSEFIWQQQDNIIMQLTDRLASSEQQAQGLQATHDKEISQLKEKEELIGSLHSTLDLQTKQFAQLEQAFEDQKVRQQEQQVEAQQQLASTLDKHQHSFAALISDLKIQADEQYQVTPTATIKNETLVEEPLKVEPEAAIEAIEVKEIEEPEAVIEVKEIEEAAQVNIINEQPALNTDPVKVASLEIEQEPIMVSAVENIQPEIEIKEAPAPVIEQKPVQAETLDVVEAFTAPKPEPAAAIIEREDIKEPDYGTSRFNLAGSFKGILGKNKKAKKDKKVATKKPVADTVSSVEQVPVQPAAPTVTKESGRLKGLLGKVKKPKEKQATENPQTLDTVDSLLVPPAPVAEVTEEFKEPDYLASTGNVAGGFKGLLGKVKKPKKKVLDEPKNTVVEQPQSLDAVDLLVASPTRLAEPEEEIKAPDYSASGINLGAFKGLLGKGKKSKK